MSPAPRILLVEDDETLRMGLKDNLEEQGYRVDAAPDGTAARKLVRDARAEGRGFDLVVLDIMLPDTDGYTLCSELRDSGERAMILMLTARALEEDIVRGFDAGADDYVAKPYRIVELLARVRALLRRSGEFRAMGGGKLGRYRVDLKARVVRPTDGPPIELTRTEFDLLVFFLDHSGRALHRQQILDEVWGAEVVVDERTIDNFVSSLKRKLGWSSEATWRITTIRGVGYRFENDDA